MARRPIARAGVAVLVLVGLEILTGCGSDPRLDALERDSMATATLPHAVLDHESTTKTHTSLGMPVHAQVLRTFTVSGVDPTIVLDQAAALATTNGWRQEFRSGTGYVGSKQLGDGAHLSITTDGRGRPSRLIIVMTADQANQ
jgi:hypothetical protein